MMAPTMPFTLHGIGGQFDNEAPFLDGYQILPRTSDDINETLNALDLAAEYEMTVFPNPSSDYIRVQANETIELIKVIDINGKLQNCLNFGQSDGLYAAMRLARNSLQIAHRVFHRQCGKQVADSGCCWR